MTSTELEPTGAYIITAAEREARADHARKRARRIRDHAVAWITGIRDAWAARDWEALGYPDWNAYCEAEFRSYGLKLDRAELGRVAPALSEFGMPVRAISAATGAGKSSVAETVRSQKPGAVVRKRTVPTEPVGNTGPDQEPAAVAQDMATTEQVLDTIITTPDEPSAEPPRATTPPQPRQDRDGSLSPGHEHPGEVRAERDALRAELADALGKVEQLRTERDEALSNLEALMARVAQRHGTGKCMPVPEFTGLPDEPPPPEHEKLPRPDIEFRPNGKPTAPVRVPMPQSPGERAADIALFGRPM
jgi:hypothetical protein